MYQNGPLSPKKRTSEEFRLSSVISPTTSKRGWSDFVPRPVRTWSAADQADAELQ